MDRIKQEQDFQDSQDGQDKKTGYKDIKIRNKKKQDLISLYPVFFSCPSCLILPILFLPLLWARWWI